MKPLAGEKILVTGASGMLGTAVLKKWGAQNEITGLSLRGLKNTLACDLTDDVQVKNLFNSHKFSFVLHTAAHSDVDSCEKDPQMAYAANALATKNLADACERSKTPLIHISTDYVFDGFAKAPYKEADATLPIQVYGLTKLAAEYFVKRITTPYIIVRTSWLFGSGNPKNFVNFMAEKIKNEKKISVLKDQTSSPTYVEDLTSWLAFVAQELLEKGGQKIFHACNSGITTRYDMTVFMRDVLGYKDCEILAVKEIPQRPAARPPRPILDNTHFGETFHLNIRPWQDSLKEYLKSQMSSACASLSQA